MAMFGSRFTIPMHAVKKAPVQWEQRNSGRQLPGKRLFVGHEGLTVKNKHLEDAVRGGWGADPFVGDRALARVEGPRGEELAANAAREKKRAKAALKARLRTMKGLQAIDEAWAQYSAQRVSHMWQFGATNRARGGLNANSTSSHLSPAASGRNRFMPTFQSRHLPGAPSGISSVKVDEGTVKVLDRKRGKDPIYRAGYGTQPYNSKAYSSPKDLVESGKAIRPSGMPANPATLMLDWSINSNIQKNMEKVMSRWNSGFAYAVGTMGLKTAARVRYWKQMLEQDVPRTPIRHGAFRQDVGSPQQRAQLGLRFKLSQQAAPRSAELGWAVAPRATSSFHSAEHYLWRTRMQERPGL